MRVFDLDTLINKVDDLVGERNENAKKNKYKRN